MVTLGVFIILILLLIIISLLSTIEKRQIEIVNCLNNVVDAVGKLNTTIINNDSIIMDNFKEVISKAVVLDSKQTSMKDMVDSIAKGLDVYQTKTMNAISFISRTSNKPRRSNKIHKPRNTSTK